MCSSGFQFVFGISNNRPAIAIIQGSMTALATFRVEVNSNATLFAQCFNLAYKLGSLQHPYCRTTLSDMSRVWHHKPISLAGLPLNNAVALIEPQHVHVAVAGVLGDARFVHTGC